MKSGLTNTVLTLVLTVVVLIGVIFALQAIFRQRQIRTIQTQMIACQSNLGRLNLLLADAIRYGKTNPDINPIIKPFEAKPAAR